MKKVYPIRARLWFALFLASITALSTGCISNDSIRQVFGENVVLTSAVIIQTVTATVFNSIFGLFGLA
ncbi:MAG: hypothetical protein H6819_08515 [Phycisphaerales bacterium]|nr:hypothetical protein [Phycisphaerales bacterium]MCB9854151.1 hypothetical protein [Phycisphaerales bacterium]MCB9864713.1 hypothetical protein [Phycisphaerales bacterium]